MQHGVTLAAPVDDRTFARRAYFDVIGLPPTPEQLRDFLFDPAADKRSKLIRNLLGDNRNYAEHWLTFWNDHLRNDYKGTGSLMAGAAKLPAGFTSRW
jgi:hypothetical protein